jgi:predicted ribosomally synthesized peptide with SipW-like signal peptide
MKKIMPLMASVMLILVAGMFAGAGTLAYFSDTEKISVADINAGTLNLQVDANDPCTQHITLSNIAPGWSKMYDWTLKNTGSITGVVKVEFSAITEIENGMNEPELVAEATVYTPAGCGQQTVGLVTGELGYLLRAKPSRAELYPSVEKSPGLPCPNSYMPNGGGLHYLGTIGSFELGRNTEEAKLAPGTTCIFRLRLGLDNNLQSWDGCSWHDIDDNVIQSDMVEFTITIHLEQCNQYIDETIDTSTP